MASPEAYYRLLGNYISIATLNEDTGTGRIANIQKSYEMPEETNRMLRIGLGVGESLKSNQNRLLERHELAKGFLWLSYDFAPEDGDFQRNIFTTPFGPADLLSTSEERSLFISQGYEVIYSLPNGLLGYALFNEIGQKVTTARQDVIYNPKYSGSKALITAGSSCLNCHSEGIHFAKDTLRSFVEDSESLEPDIRSAVLAIHPKQDKIDKTVEADRKQYHTALAETQFFPPYSAGIMQAEYQYKKPLKLSRLASELNLTQQQYEAIKSEISAEMLELLRPSHKDGLERSVFAAHYQELVEAIFYKVDPTPIDEHPGEGDEFEDIEMAGGYLSQ